MNRLALEQSGSLSFVRDRGRLGSAVTRPVNRWHDGEQDHGALAAPLLIGVARAYPFEQGNKRPALLAAAGFLQVDGFRLDWPAARAAGSQITAHPLTQPARIGKPFDRCRRTT